MSVEDVHIALGCSKHVIVRNLELFPIAESIAVLASHFDEKAVEVLLQLHAFLRVLVSPQGRWLFWFELSRKNGIVFGFNRCNEGN